jgi:sarcosine oxidase delta subunit
MADPGTFVIKVQRDVRRAQRKLDRLRRPGLNELMASAVNDVAYDFREAMRGEFTIRFDRPTPFTMNSVLVSKKAQVYESSPFAVVKLRDEAAKGTPPVKYLEPGVRGGRRRLKGHERALARIGLLYPGEYAVPAGGARIDAYGNISSGQIVQILSQMRAFGEQGYDANATRSKRSKAKRQAAPYFYVRVNRGGLRRGIWQRIGGRVRPVLLFVRKAPRYTARINMERLARQVMAREWPRAVERRFGRLSRAIEAAAR